MSRFGLILLVPFGAVIALLGHPEGGVVIAVVGAVATLLIHLWSGIASYRRAMDHDWPYVKPRDWEDDD